MLIELTMASQPTPSKQAGTGKAKYNPVAVTNDDLTTGKKSGQYAQEMEETVTIGSFTFVPVAGFREAIEDPHFRASRFLDILTTIIGCDAVYSDEMEDFCVDEQLPYLAMAAATSPFVRGEIDGEPFIDIALRLVLEDQGRRELTTLVNPILADILVASVQPDVDNDSFWEELEMAFLETGNALNEDQVLAILQSDKVKSGNKPFFQRLRSFFQSSMF